MKQVTAIIPCRGDAERLMPLLQHLHADGRVEIIVIEAGETRAAEPLVEAVGGRYFNSDAPRGARLQAAAKHANTPCLWFLHADAHLAPGSVSAVLDAVSQGQAGGCFRFRITGGRTLTKALLEWGVALRCAFGGTAYGDQGLFFKKTAYERAGGHDPVGLFEEVRLLRTVRRFGVFLPVALDIGVDERRWQRDGFWSRTLANRLLAICYSLGVNPERLAVCYAARK